MTDHAIGRRSSWFDLNGIMPTPAFAGLIALCLGLLGKWPTLAITGQDDAFFSEVATLWRHGLAPYLNAFDVKPPGIFALLALVQGWLGPDLLTLRLLGALGDAMTMGLVYRIAWRAGSPGVGVLAMLAFACLSNGIIADDCYSVLVATTALAMTIAMSDLPSGRKALLAGLTIGAAGLIKQTAAFEGVALLAILVGGQSGPARRAQVAALYAAAAAVPPLICLAYFWAIGGLTILLNDIVVFALQRPAVSSDNVTFLQGLGRIALYSLTHLPILFIAAPVALFAHRLPHFRREAGALGLWFAASLLGLIVQRALLPTYYAPVLPSALLLTGFGLAARLNTRQIRLLLALAIAWGGIVFAKNTQILSRPHDDFTLIDRVTGAIQAAGPKSDDRLYLIGAKPQAVWVYVRSGLRPATPFLIPIQQACAFPNAGPGRIDDAFAARPRFVVTGGDRKSYTCEDDDLVVKINARLARDYRLVLEAENDLEAYHLYERLPETAQ